MSHITHLPDPITSPKRPNTPGAVTMRMSLTAVGLLLLVGSATSAIVTVTPGVDNLQTAINAANDGDELVLDDGTYTSSTTVTPNAVASIDSGNGFLPTFITIRAKNSLKAIIDGESTNF